MEYEVKFLPASAKNKHPLLPLPIKPLRKKKTPGKQTQNEPISPYVSCAMMTSGAIQYGDPANVCRFAMEWVNCTDSPKSASLFFVGECRECVGVCVKGGGEEDATNVTDTIQ